jgi:hypothetical protein
MAKGKGGRKPLWDELDMPNKIEAVRGWTMQGSTDKDIMAMLEISHDTFYKWKKERSEFADALKKGKDIANGELLNAAFRQAKGYYQTVTEPMKVRLDDGSEVIEMVTYDKFIPANNTMAIFMMKNRMPEHYKDKHEHKHDGQVSITFVNDLPDDDEE